MGNITGNHNNDDGPFDGTGKGVLIFVIVCLVLGLMGSCLFSALVAL